VEYASTGFRFKGKDRCGTVMRFKCLVPDCSAGRLVHLGAGQVCVEERGNHTDHAPAERVRRLYGDRGDDAPPPAKRVRFADTPTATFAAAKGEPTGTPPWGHTAGEPPGLLRQVGEQLGVVGPLTPHDLAGDVWQKRVDEWNDFKREDLDEDDKEEESRNRKNDDNLLAAAAFRKRVLGCQQLQDKYPGLAALCFAGWQGVGLRALTEGVLPSKRLKPKANRKPPP